MPSYYDIDTILAEEELLTVKPKFDFAHLSHIDPDSHRAALVGRKRRRDDDGTDKNDKLSGGGHHHYLPEGTKIKMPLWAIDRWSMLNFIKMPTLPRHYRQRMKERLEADAVTMNLCNKNDHFFLAGTLLTNLLLRTVYNHKRNSTSSRRSSRGNPNDPESVAMETLTYEARTLQHSLLTTMMGDRLCRNFDWTLSALDAMEDDVSLWIERLSNMEKKMFDRGVEASGAVKSWREYGCSRMGVSLAVVKGRGTTTRGGNASDKKRVVTPTGNAAAGGVRSF